jgi:hypothetical protein
MIAVLAVLLTAGCGGSSRLSKSDFDAKANAICAKYDAQIKAIEAPKGIGDVPHYVDQVKPLIENGVDEIDGLRPPENLQDTFDRWVSTQREALDQADQLRSAAAKSNLLVVNRVIKELGERNKRGNELAGKLGAQTCAQE